MPKPLLPASTWTSPLTPPALSIHPRRIRALITRLRTPELVQHWIYSLRYNPRDTMNGLYGVVRNGEAHCLEAAIAAATILEYHGYPPLILDLESADNIDHTLFLFRRKGKYGTVGMSKDLGLHGRKPVYANIRTLVQSYAAPYIDHKASLIGYTVFDLRSLKQEKWRTAAGNLWYIEKTLLRIPHRHFSTSPAFRRSWRNRYAAFQLRFPGRQPGYYSGKKFWL